MVMCAVDDVRGNVSEFVDVLNAHPSGFSSDDAGVCMLLCW